MNMIWVGQSSTSLLKQGRYVTLGGRGDAWGILSIYWNINFDPWSKLEIFGNTWPLINKRNFWTDLCRSVFSTSASSRWPTGRGRFLLSTFFSRNRFHACYVLAIILSLSTSVDVHYNQEVSLKTLQQISCTLSTFGSGGGDKETTALCLLPLNVMQVGRFHGYYLRLPMTYDNHPFNPIPSVLT